MRPSRFRAKVLQPGTYVFQLGPTQSSRNILQVFDKDGRELLATMMTVPKKRQDPKGDVVLTFGAAPSGHAPALQAYFYPGTIYGHELVYSDEEARDLAKRYRTLVLAQDRKGTDMERRRCASSTIAASRGTTSPAAPWWQPVTTGTSGVRPRRRR